MAIGPQGKHSTANCDKQTFLDPNGTQTLMNFTPQDPLMPGSQSTWSLRSKVITTPHTPGEPACKLRK
ncbi:hypothetical protein XENTR_v10013398 [Xenopus tropicalis]|nr:hypothetical protein XENTR_v10013398 [Xenopus tropicalis]